MRDGTEIQDRNTLLHHTWKNAQIHPPIYKTQSLIDKPLVNMQDLKIESSAPEINDKGILVCVFDMQQRPSRRYVLELAGQANNLEQKGIAVFAVQATKVDEDKLNKWVKENNIPFPVDMIKAEEKKTQAGWGVKYLPWLILTDEHHIVITEGFSLDELKEKIGDISEK
jgi:hypothetical protein